MAENIERKAGMGRVRMIKIIKTEYASEFSPIVRTEHIKDLDFFDLTAFDLTTADFADYFKEHIGDFGNITSVHDDGSYISVKYERQNSGILEIYPEPPPVAKKPDKRPTKNLESLVALCNKHGFRVDILQLDREGVGLYWHGNILNLKDSSMYLSWGVHKTAYAALKNAILESPLKEFLYADTKR
jgi:hypothetical protein